MNLVERLALLLEAGSGGTGDGGGGAVSGASGSVGDLGAAPRPALGVVTVRGRRRRRRPFPDEAPHRVTAPWVADDAMGEAEQQDTASPTGMLGWEISGAYTIPASAELQRKSWKRRRGIYRANRRPMQRRSR